MTFGFFVGATTFGELEEAVLLPEGCSTSSFAPLAGAGVTTGTI